MAGGLPPESFVYCLIASKIELLGDARKEGKMNSEQILPRRLARLWGQLGHDAIHTLDLPEQNRTPDETIIYSHGCIPWTP
jgi:hypothetical protein